MTSKLQAIKETVEKLDREAEDSPWKENPSLGDLWLKMKRADLFPALLRIAEELEAKLDQMPADWFEDSSLETWFPLSAETLKDRTEVVEKYATSARVIALHLKPFCDQRLSYDEMIADASRKAAKRIEELEARIESAELRFRSIEAATDLETARRRATKGIAEMRRREG